MFSDNSKWITFDKKYQSVSVYGEFDADDSACDIDICGLGYFELYINGKKVSDDVLVPAWSDYCERDFSTLLYPSSDKMRHRAYYLNYDLAPYIKAGKNEFCIMLGNGWFRQKKRVIEGENHYSDNLLLRFDIRYNSNGELKHCVSHSKCRYAPNFIEENNIFYGEVHDCAKYTQEVFYRAPSKTSVAVETQFDSPLFPQTCPADKETEDIGFSKVGKGKRGVIYKADVTLSGYAVLKANGGDVKVTYADALNKDRTFNFLYTGGDEQIAADFFRNTAKGQILKPHFVWHAFTYFEVEGEAEVLCVKSVHADLWQVARFKCDNETLNWLFDAYARTQLQNMHGGVPSDCPHRERLGYTGDGQLTAETAMLIFDSREFYRKWIADIEDCQDIKSGHIQHTAPFYGGGGGPGGWGCAIVVVPYMHFMRYSEPDILREAFPFMAKWVESMESFCDENGLVVREYDKGWCLGEWCTPEKLELPEPFVNTYYYVKALEYMTRICDILGGDGKKIAELKARSKNAIKEKYFASESGSFCRGVQGADAFGYSLGLGNEKTADNIRKKYAEAQAFDTGIFGTEVLSSVLAELGEYDTLFKLFTSEEIGSFGYMKKQGVTTLWEDWDGRNSRNHPMFGAAVKHLIYGFAGINVLNGKITVSPHLVRGINKLDCSVDLPQGRVRLHYEKASDKIEFALNCDCEAEFIFGNIKTSAKGKYEISVSL